MYVTSFQYLVLLYQDEMRQIEKKLQLLKQPEMIESLGKNRRKSGVMKFFSSSESQALDETSMQGGGDTSVTEEFGVSQDINFNEIEDECMVWYCSCVNDIWRACSRHFVRQKFSRSLSSLSKGSPSLHGNIMGSIDEEEDEEDVYTEWDGIGVVSDEIRKIEREFSKAMRYGLLVVINSMFSRLDELLSLTNFKKSWIDALAMKGHHDKVSSSFTEDLVSHLPPRHSVIQWPNA